MASTTQVSADQQGIILGDTHLSSTESLLFAQKLEEFVEDLQDYARIANHDPKNTIYKDASVLDTILEAHANS